jgi:tRNA(Ile)-lysidine synthase
MAARRPAAPADATRFAEAAARFRADLGAVCDLAADRVLVAVSGGPDSLALLLLAHAVLGERCLAATVDHGLRPASAGEAAFVSALCAERGIGHATLTAPMPERVGRTANLSTRARALRYRLLEAHAEAQGARRLATAHHADDQLETLVMRLNRGAGLAGLAGIRAAGGRIVRPLLGWRRAELVALVRDAGVVAVDDPSNRDDRFDRARLRKELATAGWLDADGWTLSARALGEAEDALGWATREAAAARLCVDGDQVSLDPRDLPPELRRRLLERCVRQLAPDADLRGPNLVAALARLESGRQTTLAGIICRPDAGRWRFALAPPRRSL